MYQVIIAEDEFFVRLGIKNSVSWEKYNMQVVCDAGNGAEALRAIQKSCPDVLITDLLMPGMGGQQLIESVRDAGLEPYIIVITCLEEFKTLQKMMSLGVRDYLLKATMTEAEIQASLQKAKEALDKQARRLDQNTLAPIRYQLSSAVQSLFIGCKQMEVNREMLEKVVALYTDMLSMSNTQSGIGMATSTDLLSAQVSLTSAKNQLSTLNNSMDSLRRTLIMLTGWDYTDNPTLGEVPQPDMSQIDTIDREADKVQAIAYNQEIISLKNTKKENRTIKDIHSKERSVTEAEEQLRSNMDTLYYNLLEKRAALQSAETAFSQAELTWQGNQRRYQLGMLGRIEYLSTEIQYVQAKAARDTARMNMLQALNEYNWALKGVVPAEI